MHASTVCTPSAVHISQVGDTSGRTAEVKKNAPRKVL
jgi:hypothetical protein